MDYPIHKELLDAVFSKHPEVVDCIAHRVAVVEQADDGVNLNVDAFEAVLKDLVAKGVILTRRTEEMEKEAELQRSKAERARRMAFNDDKRALRKMDRETWEREMKKRRAEEARANQEAVAEENKKLQDLSVEELRARIRAEEVAKGFQRSVRKGNDADGIW